MFNIVAKPNEWSREVKQKASTSTSDLKLQQQRFWQMLHESLKERGSTIRSRKVRPQHWYDFSIGRSDTWLTATINSQKKCLSVEFNFRGPDGKLWFDQLLRERPSLDARLGPDLSWQRLDGKRQSRIALYLENADPTDEKDWPRQRDWLIEKLELFQHLFSPLAAKLNDTVGISEEGGHTGSDGLPDY
jgi:hypothetical protein